MTPPARIAAAAGVLDAALAGQALERALLGWARGARYAGSKDRAAVRDLAFGAWRRRRSSAWLGGSETGRGLMIGWLRSRDEDPSVLMNGEGRALPPPNVDEVGLSIDEAPRGVRLDLPDWLLARFDASLGGGSDQVGLALRDRAPTFLRVNPRHGDIAAAQQLLEADGILTNFVENVSGALQVVEGEPAIRRSAAYLTGLVELQDASSQAAILRLPLHDGASVLDLCAGGGGKTLAMAARASLSLAAYDVDPARMADLPPRAARAGLDVRILADPSEGAPYDLVLIDAPCSGSGTWRRAPDAKWRLTPNRLASLVTLQRRLLDQAVELVVSGGMLAYATCSVLREEGAEQVEAFLSHRPNCVELDRFETIPSSSGDGFFQSVLQRN